MLRKRLLAGVISLTSFCAMSASAQSHFTSCLNGKGNIFNATLILPLSAAPTVNSMPLAVGSEVAVFSTEPGAQELCVGVLTWKNVNSALAIWGDDPVTPVRDGLRLSNEFSFRIWDSSLGFEFSPNAILSTFSNGTPSYDHDEIYVLTNLTALGSFGGITTVDDDVVIDEDMDVLVDVSANDVSGGTESLYLKQIGRPANGTASIEGDGEIRYTPHINYYGLDSLSYVISDVSQNLGEGMLRIQILSVNDAPIITSSPPKVTNIERPYVFTILALDVEGDPLRFTPITLPDWLILETTGEGIATISGTADASHLGDHEIEVEVSDGVDSSRISYILTVVGSTNQSPVASDDEYFTDEDADAILDVLENDVDPDGDFLFVTGVESTGSSTVGIRSDGKLDFSPAANMNGSVQFTYTVSDSSGAAAVGTVSVTIAPVNDFPEITSDPVVEATSGIPYSYLVTAADVDNDALVFSLDDAPSWLTMNQQSQGAAEVTISGIPGDEDGGIHSVSIVVNDGVVTVSQDFEIFVTAIGVEVPVSLVAPVLLFESEAIEVSTSPRLEWEPVSGATRYHLQVAEDLGSNFGKLVVDDSEIFTSHYQISTLESNTWYEWRVRALNGLENGPWSSISSFQTGSKDRLSENDDHTSPFDDSNNTKPESFQLYQNYPNPFNPETTITFDVPSSIRVVVDIYDLLGHHIVTLVDDRFNAGRHSVRWSAQDLPSGIYLYRMVAGNVVQSRTLSLIK
ncbi:MAG: tandem-95 repeat protein [Bacteroidetes bacterium]|nr:tandem-95 repeat protein [Bacteroidota bacterium]